MNIIYLVLNRQLITVLKEKINRFSMPSKKGTFYIFVLLTISFWSCEDSRNSSTSQHPNEIDKAVESFEEIDPVDQPDATLDVVQVDTLLKDSLEIDTLK